MGILLCGCVAAPPPGLGLRDSIEGVWGAPNSDLSCRNNPRKLSFSPDGLELRVEYAEPILALGFGIEKRFVYEIIEESKDSMRVALRGEYRRTGSGELAKWDFILIDYRRACLKRADWHPALCEQIVRC